MATRKLCFALVMSAALAACGSPDAPAGADGAPSPSGAAAQPERSKAAAQPDRSRVAATAAEVAAEARGNVKCPAKVSTAPRPGLSAHDVVGVRPGMTWDEAVNVVLCTHELLVVTENRSRRFEVNTWGQAVRQGFDAVFAEDRINKTSQEILAEMQDSAMARGTNRRSPGMPGGTARWYVTTMGVPGDERVVAATRLEAYAEDKAPTMAGVRDALVEKYGAPTSVFEGGVWELRWVYDLQDRQVPETHPVARSCVGPSHPDSAVNLSTNCGVIVTATINPLRDNPLIANSLQVGVVDQARGYESLAATERALEQAELARRAEEAKAAAERAGKPTL